MNHEEFIAFLLLVGFRREGESWATAFYPQLWVHSTYASKRTGLRETTRMSFEQAKADILNHKANPPEPGYSGPGWKHVGTIQCHKENKQ